MANNSSVQQDVARAQSSFDANLQSVLDLVNFDHVILDTCLSHLNALSEKLEQHHRLANPYLSARNTIQLITAIRDHDSLRTKYEAMFNQALVLQVSYFASAIHQLFRASLAHFLAHFTDTRIQREEIRFSVEELRTMDYDLRDRIANIIISKKDYSFQDMQSINRAFEECYKFTPNRDANVDNIILAQACRHVIVHAGSIADERMVRQLSNATRRTVKATIIAGKHIQFTPAEIELVGASMRNYVADAVAFVNNNL
jgi:hypothetical protein